MPGNGEPVEVDIDGTTARATRYGTGDTGAILIHGLMSDSRELGPWPAILADHGFTVLAIDLRGHGASQGPRGVVTVDGVLEDLQAWHDHLDDQAVEAEVVGGHSLGGAWAMAWASRNDVQAVVAACSPATITAELSGIEQAAYRVGGAAHRLAAQLGYDRLAVPYEVGPEDLLDDPEAIEKAREMGLPQDTIPLANVATLLHLDATGWAKQVECPGLIAAARDDRVVARANTRSLYEAYAGPKDWLELDGPHACFLDTQGHRCAEQVSQWVKGVVS